MNIDETKRRFYESMINAVNVYPKFDGHDYGQTASDGGNMDMKEINKSYPFTTLVPPEIVNFILGRLLLAEQALKSISEFKHADFISASDESKIATRALKRMELK